MEAKIKEALAKLDTANDDDWTPGGLPNLARVKELTGSDVTRKEIAEAVPGYNRETAKSAPSDLSNVGGGNEGKPSEISEAKPKEGDGIAYDANDPNHPGELKAYDAAEDKMRMPTADEIAKFIPDAMLLIEAFVILSSTPRYMRNVPLTNIARAWQVEQKGARELQARLDQRARERKAREAELEAAADNA